MRKLAMLGAAAVLGLIGSANAAPVLTVSMTATPVAGTPGLFDVKVFAVTSGGESDATDGGLAGFQFDILSDGTNKAAPLANGTGPNANKAKTTFDPLIVANFSSLVPQKVDGNPSQNPTANPPYVPDTDLDAIGGSFSDQGFKNTRIGFGSPQLIATEQWQLANPNVGDALRLHIIGPLFYNNTATLTNFQTAYLATQYNTGNIVAPLPAVPEPASLALLGLSGLAAIRRRRA